MAKLKLDLHDIYNRGGQIDAELNRIIQEAIDKRVALVEISPGKAAASLRNACFAFSTRRKSASSITASKKMTRILDAYSSTFATDFPG